MIFFVKKTAQLIFFLFTSILVIYSVNIFSMNHYDYFYQYEVIFGYSFFIIIFIAFVLSSLFNKSRMFFILSLIFLVQVISGDSLFIDIISSWAKLPVKDFITLPIEIIFLVISLNLIIFSLYRERGIFNTWGLKRFFMILVQLYGSYLLVSKDLWYGKFISYLNIDFINLNIPVFDVPDLYLLLIFFAFIFFVIKLKNAENYAFLFIFINLIISLLFLGRQNEISILVFSSISVLILIFAIIKDSYSMAYIDELTDLPSRRALREELLKLGNNYSIAMLDIDFFKKFNDKYGHDTGDQVLRRVAAIMKKTKGGAKVYRYGGEEFTLIFSGKGLESVYPYLEKLRSDIAKNPFVIRGKDRPKRKSSKKSKKSSISKDRKVKITVSIGVAEKTDKYDNPNEVIKGADKALYKAKKNGRNCVIK